MEEPGNELGKMTDIMVYLRSANQYLAGAARETECWPTLKSIVTAMAAISEAMYEQHRPATHHRRQPK